MIALILGNGPNQAADEALRELTLQFAEYTVQVAESANR